jgi:hypothetical protein
MLTRCHSWEIAIPCVFGVIVFIMRGMIIEYVRSVVQRRHIFNLKKERRKKKQKSHFL